MAEAVEEGQSWVGVGYPDVLIIIPANLVITSLSSASWPPPSQEILVHLLCTRTSLFELSTAELDPLLN